MPDEIRIRMYRVGFGDCFLVTLPETGGTKKHILVDCGAHFRGNLHYLPKVMENVAKETDGNLSVIVATHSHQDHISGFAECAAIFSGLKIGEVWLPWTDDPADTEAQALQHKQLALAASLEAHFNARADAAEATKDALANLTGNKAALDGLHSGFGTNARVRYLAAGDQISAPAEIAGLNVTVLGPPPKTDRQFMEVMDPPRGDTFIRAAAGTLEAEYLLRPFPQRLAIAPEVYEAEFDKNNNFGLAERRKELAKELSDPDLDSLAFVLDDVRNNTSLVTLLKFRNRTLLFPGDAQYGNWHYWLDHLDGLELLSQVDFLKVSHHGSINASPREAIERLKNVQAAMVSTQNKPWDSIPRQPLLDELSKLTSDRIVRSDSLILADRPDAPAGPAIANMPDGFDVGEFWYDYRLTL